MDFILACSWMAFYVYVHILFLAIILQFSFSSSCVVICCSNSFLPCTRCNAHTHIWHLVYIWRTYCFCNPHHVRSTYWFIKEGISWFNASGYWDYRSLELSLAIKGFGVKELSSKTRMFINLDMLSLLKSTFLDIFHNFPPGCMHWFYELLIFYFFWYLIVLNRWLLVQ